MMEVLPSSISKKASGTILTPIKDAPRLGLKSEAYSSFNFLLIFSSFWPTFPLPLPSPKLTLEIGIMALEGEIISGFPMILLVSIRVDTSPTESRK